VETARSKAKTAMTISIVSMVLSLLLWVGIVLINILGIFAAGMSGK
jgi:hypothetical protein